MTNDECYYVRSGRSFKEKRKTIGTISDLKNFITKHFNLPHIQVTEGLDGGVVIANLFEGIPDDIESQDHEVFDNILKLVGWIEGCIELPECSKSVATVPKEFNESPRAMEEISDRLVPKDLECDVLNDDVRSNEEALKIDGVLVQKKTTDELKVEKETSGLVAYQVLDEMLKPQADVKDFEVNDMSDVKRLLVVNKEFTDLIKGRDELPVQEDVSFDPGGKFEVTLEAMVTKDLSHLVAHQVFDEIHESQKCSEHELLNEIKGCNVSTDDYMNPAMNYVLVENSDVMKNDDAVFEDVLKIDGIQTQGEELVQMKLKDETDVAKQISNLVTHQGLDGMAKLMFSHKGGSDTPILSGAPSIGVVVNQTNLLVSKSGQVSFILQRWLLANTWVVVDSYDEMLTFDPGGTCLSFLADEDMGSNEEQDRLKVIELMDVKGDIPSLLVKNEFPDLFVLLNELTVQGKMMKGYEKVYGFDPGGVDLTFAHRVNCLSCRSVFLLMSSGPEMFDEFSFHMFGAFADIGCEHMMITTVGDVFGDQIHNIPRINNTLKVFKVIVNTEFVGLVKLLRKLSFDLGGRFHTPDDVVLSINDSELWDSLVRMNAKHKSLRIFEVESSSVLLVNAMLNDMDLLNWFMVHNPLLMLNYHEKLKLVPIKCSYFDSQNLVFDPGITFKEEWKSETEFDVVDKCLSQNLKLIFLFFDLRGEGARLDDHVIYLSVTDEFAYMSEIALSRGKWLMQTEVERGFLIWIVLPCFILVIYQRVLELGKRKVNMNLQDRLIGDASMVIKLEEFAEMKTHSLLLEVAEELVVFGKKFLKSYVAIGLHILISQDQVEITHKRIVSTVVRLLIGWTAREVIASSLTCLLEARSLVWLKTTSTTDLHHYISCRILIFYEIVTDDP